MKLLARASLLMVLALAGCDLPLISDSGGEQTGFRVSAALGQVRLRNNTPDEVHYVIYSEGAIVDLNPNPEEWPSLHPGEMRRIPYAEIRGESRDVDGAVVYWWNGEGGYQEPLRVAFR